MSFLCEMSTLRIVFIHSKNKNCINFKAKKRQNKDFLNYDFQMLRISDINGKRRWILTPLLKIFQLYLGVQFHWCRNQKKTTDLPQVTNNLYTDLPQVTNNLYHKVILNSPRHWENQAHNLSSNRNKLHSQMLIQLSYDHKQDGPSLVLRIFH